MLSTNVAGTTIVALLFALIGSTAFGQVPHVSPLPHDWVRGTNFFALSADGASDNATLQELINLPKLLPGVDMVALQWEWYQSSYNSSDVHAYDRTPSTRSLIEFVHTAHRVGLSVFFKPLVVAADGSQMAQLNPTNVSGWFEAYEDLFLLTAALAEDLAVEQLSVGLELQLIATNADNTEHWERLIRRTRGLYSGTLTYGSNPLVGETPAIPFWNLLDVIGVDVYIPVVNVFQPNASLTPTAEVMAATYAFILELKLLGWYRNVSSSLGGMKMFVCESGYPSSNAGMESPWIIPRDPYGCTGYNAMNQTAQAAAFATQFRALQGTPDYFAGFIQFWYGNPGTSDYVGTPGSLWPCGWTPTNKAPTMAVLRAAYARAPISITATAEASDPGITPTAEASDP